MSGMELLAVAVLAASWAWVVVGAHRTRTGRYDGDDLTWQSGTLDNIQHYWMWDQADPAISYSGPAWPNRPLPVEVPGSLTYDADAGTWTAEFFGTPSPMPRYQPHLDVSAGSHRFLGDTPDTTPDQGP